MNKFIEFEDTLALGDNSYEVIGVTAIETESNKYSKYKTYLLK